MSHARALARSLYKARGSDVHKGDFGRVLVAGGSVRYAGVLAFNALAALRAGADIAIVVAPTRAADLVASYAPDLIAIPTPGPFPDPDVVARELAHADALVLGGGVDLSEEARRAMRTIVASCGKPMVLDAGALHAIAEAPGLLARKKALLTPNPKEFAILAGAPWPDAEDARVAATRDLARARSASVIVKGRRDVISDGERTSLDEAGSSYLTKGGHGDLLAGACGALLARGASPFDAARVGALIVGRAGELAAEKFHEGTLASDALARIPDALAGLLA